MEQHKNFFGLTGQKFSMNFWAHCEIEKVRLLTLQQLQQRGSEGKKVLLKKLHTKRGRERKAQNLGEFGQ